MDPQGWGMGAAAGRERIWMRRGASTQEAPEPRYSTAPTLWDLLWVPTSKQPCWRWWESGIAGWERSWICSGCGWMSSSGKGSPQGSLLWRGSAGERSGSCWWPCAGACRPARGISAPGSAPAKKTNACGQGELFQQLFPHVTKCYKSMEFIPSTLLQWFPQNHRIWLEKTLTPRQFCLLPWEHLPTYPSLLQALSNLEHFQGTSPTEHLTLTNETNPKS